MLHISSSMQHLVASRQASTLMAFGLPILPLLTVACHTLEYPRTTNRTVIARTRTTSPGGTETDNFAMYRFDEYLGRGVQVGSLALRQVRSSCWRSRRGYTGSSATAFRNVAYLQDGIVSMKSFDMDNSRGLSAFSTVVIESEGPRTGWCTIDRVFTPARYSGLLQISSSQYPRWTCVSLHTSHQLHNLSPWVVEPVLDPPPMPESPLARRPIGLGETPERVTHGCQQSVLHRVGILDPTRKH
ncbi:hypothetical protein B0J15DRAFT_171651 [Fusarium solani]|uniref:Uncharacterized protein n=1 Tax=Fusarium solani TaxID=169388 RepID=A0A9P9L126_FUSSL|nr:uncharacterized protein B0J15DRAFT_171651 [Fusarium solani]KAH7272252.1 hypothetical protein B0J15DRAFT_171651 [Fusarium solani]